MGHKAVLRPDAPFRFQMPAPLSLVSPPDSFPHSKRTLEPRAGIPGSRMAAIALASLLASPPPAECVAWILKRRRAPSLSRNVESFFVFVFFGFDSHCDCDSQGLEGGAKK